MKFDTCKDIRTCDIAKLQISGLVYDNMDTIRCIEYASVREYASITWIRRAIHINMKL